MVPRTKIVPFIIGLACVGALFVVVFFVIRTSPIAAAQDVTVRVGGLTVRAEVARTAAEQRRGLSFRTDIPPNGGMLFPLNPPRETSFWMFGMQFPIDIIWIQEGRVVGVAHNTQPPGPSDRTIETYGSPGAVSHVLEVNAGTAAAYNIGVGDAVGFE